MRAASGLSVEARVPVASVATEPSVPMLPKRGLVRRSASKGESPLEIQSLDVLIHYLGWSEANEHVENEQGEQ